MRHLIVEACITRNLIDTSAYFWPGYVSTSATSQSDTSAVEKSPWATFMEGEPLNCSLVNSLSTTPASRYNGKISLFDFKKENLLLIDFLCFVLKFSRDREDISYCIKWVRGGEVSSCKDSVWCIPEMWMEHSGSRIMQ